MRERLSDVRYCGVHSRATKHLASRARAALPGFFVRGACHVAKIHFGGVGLILRCGTL